MITHTGVTTAVRGVFVNFERKDHGSAVCAKEHGEQAAVERRREGLRERCGGSQLAPREKPPELRCEQRRSRWLRRRRRVRENLRERPSRRPLLMRAARRDIRRAGALANEMQMHSFRVHVDGTVTWTLRHEISKESVPAKLDESKAEDSKQASFLEHSSQWTKCSLPDIARRRTFCPTYLENGRDECIVLLSARTQCMSVSVPGTCQYRRAFKSTS